MKRILLDTGILVGVITKRDQYHTVCVETMKSITVPRITTWAVLTEAAWILKSNGKALKRLIDSERFRFYEIENIGAEALLWIGRFIQRYR